MSNKQDKKLRKEVKEAVRELLPEQIQLVKYEELNKKLEARILEMESHLKKVLHELNERHKDTMGYLVRNVTTGKVKPD